ncbi:MAG TPA: hypothetical protein VN598_18505 [Usitatibacter sp.]|nr:hypothetical protein [Usitatibacter sp.]
MENLTQASVLDARAEVEHAVDIAQVVALCGKFLAGWNAHRRAALPESCQPPAKLDDARAISEYAFILAQAHCKEDHVTAELHAMAAFFTSAAARNAQLARVAPGDRVPVFVRGFL